MLAVISRLGHLVIRALHLSYRYRFVKVENIQGACKASKHGNYLFALWHQNLFPAITAQIGRPHIVMVSKSKDAHAIAYALQKLGNLTVRGSSRNSSGVDKGGRVAKDQMIEILKTGIPGAISVDGPKGPAHHVKPGILDMAKNTEIPIVPYIAIADRSWVFNSWDKFRVPKPFSKIIIGYGEPILIPPNLPYENYRTIQEEIRVRLTEEEKWFVQQFKNWDNLPRENYHS